MENNDDLSGKYSIISKHSNYQIIPSCLLKYVDISQINIKSRYENERLAFILSKIDIHNKSIIDVGGNTGFFSFELIENGAKSVSYIEGNKEHFNFVELGVKKLNWDIFFNLRNEYLDFSNIATSNKYDIGLLLNVLHHVDTKKDTDDFDSVDCKKKILDALINFSYISKIVVFQLGFNWNGDISKPLFNNGTKKEIIEFIEENTKEHFQIHSIGIANVHNKNVIYKDLNNSNIERDDSVGEFLNRPIFILRSLKI